MMRRMTVSLLSTLTLIQKRLVRHTNLREKMRLLALGLDVTSAKPSCLMARLLIPSRTPAAIAAWLVRMQRLHSDAMAQLAPT